MNFWFSLREHTNSTVSQDLELLDYTTHFKIKSNKIKNLFDIKNILRYKGIFMIMKLHEIEFLIFKRFMQAIFIFKNFNFRNSKIICNFFDDSHYYDTNYLYSRVKILFPLRKNSQLEFCFCTQICKTTYSLRIRRKGYK